MLDEKAFLLIVVGLSGAGKSTAIRALADQGFYAVENFPFELLEELSNQLANNKKFKKTAIALDLEASQNFEGIQKVLNSTDITSRILFLDCKTEIILRRYSETRRPHPGFIADSDKTLTATIQRERNELSKFKGLASYSLDSSDYNVHELRREVINSLNLIISANNTKLRINFMSFGFKHGAPINCDMIFDVRFIPNPYFREDLKHKSGKDQEVYDYVISNPATSEFLKELNDLLKFLIPKYLEEGRAYLNIGIGCTGGQHRSVAIAEYLANSHKSDKIFSSVQHRDS